MSYINNRSNFGYDWSDAISYSSRYHTWVFIIFHSGMGQFLFTICFLGVLVYIFQMIHTFKKLNLQNDVLTIMSLSGNDHSFNLGQVASWKEQKFYLRGDLKRSLILFVKDEKIIISNYDSKIEFEKILQTLKTKFPEREL